MDKTAELLDRIAALELRVAQLEARPQPAFAMGGAGGWAFPWGTHIAPSADGTQARVTVTGDNVSRETSMGPNGSTGKP